MTVAVQGDWGSGKSTALNFINYHLSEPKVFSVRFNTWLYSQFTLEEPLIFSLAEEILTPLSLNSNYSEIARKKFREFSRGLMRSAVKQLITGAGNALLVPEIAATVWEEVDPGVAASDPIQELKTLRRTFQKAIKDFRKANDVDRVVVLIDDLDRIERALTPVVGHADTGFGAGGKRE